MCFSHHVSWSRSFADPSTSAFCPCTTSPQLKKIQEKKMKKIKEKNFKRLGERIKNLIMEAVVRLKKSCQILLGTYNCPYKCSLRRAIGLVRGPWIPLHVQCWPPPGLFLDVLLVPYVVDIQQLWVCGSGSFTWSSRSYMGWMLGKAKS